MLSRGRFLVLSAGGLAGCSSSTGSIVPNPAPQPSTEEFEMGAILDPTEFQAAPQALAPEALLGPTYPGGAPVPGARGQTVLTNLPSVNQQGVGTSIGSPGTCEAESFGYGLGSYTAARNPDGTPKWSPTTAPYRISTAWLFAWAMVNPNAQHPYATCPRGGLALQYLEQLIQAGAPSEQDVPYNPNNVTQPSEMCTYFSGINTTTPYNDQINFVIGSYKVILSGGGAITADQQTKLLSRMKRYVDAGHAIAFSGHVAPHYTLLQPPLTNDVFFVSGTPQGGHGQLIVGYDDTKGGVGAFLVQNSFGTAWNAGDAKDPGRNGRIWYSYSGWFASQTLAAIAFPAKRTPPVGLLLNSNNLSAPTAAVGKAYNWYDPETGTNYLVLQLEFADAITLQSVNVTETASGAVYTDNHAGRMRTGYTYVSRADGKPFANGSYTITLTATSKAGSVTYAGTIAIPLV